jgi:hypothetical protein
VSRDQNDALEAAQVTVRELDGRIDALDAAAAGAQLQEARLRERLSSVKRHRQARRARLDARPGSGLLTVVGLCLGALLARGAWELRPQLAPDERVGLAVVALATSLALTVSRTHWHRLGLSRRG